jgi:hypothetical protein
MQLWYERRQISDGFQIISCLTTLSLLLFSTDDEDVLVNVLSALQLVLPGVPQQNICERLLVLLGYVRLIHMNGEREMVTLYICY